MQVQTEQLPELRVAALRHLGPYEYISQAFARLGQLADQAGLLQGHESPMLAIYHDDPDTTRPEDLRADAGVVVPKDAKLPAGLAEQRIPAGRYARVEHVGPYQQLGQVWARFKHDWLPAAGQQTAPGPSFEIYRNTPMTAKPEELITHLYIPVA